jgi:cytochrome c peroxidase
MVAPKPERTTMRHRPSHYRWLSSALAGIVLAGVVVAQPPAFEWGIPDPFPKPAVPADNAMNAAKVEMGRRLFYDTRLSGNGRQSCASCHKQSLAFTDSLAVSVGTTDQRHPRGSMSLANTGYNPVLTWANPAMQSLEEQALLPMFGTDPVELGLDARDPRFLRELQRDSVYKRLFSRAFPGEATSLTVDHVVRAIAAFERTMISVQSPYDRFRAGDQNAISEAAKRGEVFFRSFRQGNCAQCHSGWNFNGNLRFEGHTDVNAEFFNTGLYNLPGEFSYPATNTGAHDFTKRREDVGKFRAPTLRNVAVTAPYMHDGSVATLSEVLDHYAAGGRTITSGPHAGVGRDNPNKSPMVRGFPMTASEKQDVIAFLESLTDSVFLRNPALSNPWKK